jgi:isoleucyl-tRNA synthetase
VVRAEPLRFSEAGVKDVVRTVLLPLQNALSFFVTYANVEGWDPKVELAKAPKLADRPELDRWLLSLLQSLVREVNSQMEGYYLFKVVPPMLSFIDDLTNWYIRRSRRRFSRNDSKADQLSAFATLYEVLVTFGQVLAPVMPFMAERLYQRLVVEPGVPGAKDSVHLCDYPTVDESRIDANVEAAMAVVRAAVGAGRILREKHKLKTRQPLRRVTVVSHDDATRAHLEHHAALLADELNVKQVTVVRDDASLASLSFKPNFKTLGKRLGPKLKTVGKAIEALSREDWAKLEAGHMLTLDGESIGKDDVLVARSAKGDVVLETVGELTVALDTDRKSVV